MSRINDLFGENKKVVNKKGAKAYLASDKENYLQMLMTNVMGDTFHASQRELTLEAVNMHKYMVQKDPNFVAKAAIYAREEGNMRSQPIMALVALSTLKNKAFLKRVFPEIIKTPNDLIDFVTLAGEFRDGRGLGRSIKREINKYLNTIDEYRAIKYSGTKKGQWSLKDIIKVTHPVPETKRSNEIFAYLVNGKLFKERTQILALEAIKRLDSEDTEKFNKDVVFLIEKGKLPYESVTGIIKPTPKIWEYLMRQMPMFALIRHLNTFEKNGVLKPNNGYIYQRLSDKEDVLKSKILPFRFMTAIKHADFDDALVMNGLEQAAEASLSNLEEITGRTVWFIDESSSMEERYIDVASVLAIAGMKKSKTCKVFGFSRSLLYPDIRRSDSISEANEKIMSCFGGGTRSDVCLKYLRGKLEDSHDLSYFGPIYNYDVSFPEKYKLTRPLNVDNIIMITDEQQDRNSDLMKHFKRYKEETNPNVKLFIINVSPYAGRSVDEEEEGVTFIYGWDNSVLDIIGYRIKDGMSHVSKVESLKL